MRTIFESSHIPLHVWLQAIYLICSSKKGISTRQIQRSLGGSLKTAWFLMHRIRLAMDESNSGPPGGEGKIVESDETYTVHKEGGPTWILDPEHGWQKRRLDADRVPVVTLVERSGQGARAKRLTYQTTRGRRAKKKSRSKPWRGRPSRQSSGDPPQLWLLFMDGDGQ
jgi:hypothetical protein